MAQKLQDQGYIPDLILHSPLLRTTQTAKILSDFFHTEAVEEKELGIGGNEKKLLKNIIYHENKKTKILFLVGHGPPLQSFIGHLLGQLCPVNMETSSAIIVKFEEIVAFGQANYLHYLTP